MNIWQRRCRELSFNRWGTGAFDPNFMKMTIGFGAPVFSENGVFTGQFDKEADPRNLCLGVWFSFVPQHYQKRVELLARSVGRNFLLERATDPIKDQFINALYTEIVHRIDPQPLFRQDRIPVDFAEPTQDAWSKAMQLGHRIACSKSIYPKDMGPSAEEGVEINYLEGEKKASIEFFNDGTACYLLRKGRDEPEAYEFNDDNIATAIDTIVAFLQGN